MVGMLFFFIILLMAFALNYRSAENQAAETEAELTRERDAVSLEKDALARERDALARQRDELRRERDRIAAERDAISAVTDHLMRDNRMRSDMLATVLDSLRERAVEVVLDPENGIVRLPEALLFDTGEAVLQPRGVRALRELAAVLALTLPCYSRAPASQQIDCPIRPKPLLEAVLVEGHTDDRPIHTSQYPSNWQLSGARAAAVVQRLVHSGVAPRRTSLSGYASQHPVTTNATAFGRARNRRVEIILTRLHGATLSQGGDTETP